MQVKDISRLINDTLASQLDDRQIQAVIREYCLAIIGSTYAEKPLSEEAWMRTKDDVEKLKHGVPLAYVTGEQFFYDGAFKVNEHVLIPRPETEELVYMVLQENDETSRRILDIGTGSGCIAVSIKNRRPCWQVMAVDYSTEALEVARKNARKFEVEVEFKEMNFLNEENWHALDKVDIIVSNPPYIGYSEKPNMTPSVVTYEPEMALFVPDDNALVFYDAIARYGQEYLTSGGKIYLEINEYRAVETLDLFRSYDYENCHVHKDMQGKPRILTANKSAI